ncbi:MAG: Rrf2 family transcriptional regulator [Spirochaetia bacterium]|jgi:Rrf2 family iron-sulfur cluster assembly transcriptional regulator|nr:Rrf2 family transcriptional regulator [Spirochaetia bacterium]
MRITTKGRYAVRAIVQLAMQGNEKPVSIRKISELENISAEFLEQIFFKLRKGDIISSVRGPGGGFLLNRAAENITIAEIFDAVGEGLLLTPCVEDSTESCERFSECIVNQLWNNSYLHFRGYFEKTSLKDVMTGNFKKSLDMR